MCNNSDSSDSQNFAQTNQMVTHLQMQVRVELQNNKLQRTYDFDKHMHAAC